MSDPLCLPRDAVLQFPEASISDQIGRPAGRADGTTITVSDPALATVAWVEGVLTVTPLAAGTVRLTAAGLAGSVEITVVEPSPTRIAFGDPTYANQTGE